jgi:DUF1680 family protein
VALDVAVTAVGYYYTSPLNYRGKHAKLLVEEEACCCACHDVVMSNPGQAFTASLFSADVTPTL